MKFLQYISVYLLIVGTLSESNVTAEVKATNTTVATRSLLIQEENKINDTDVALFEKEILEEIGKLPDDEQEEFFEFMNNIAEIFKITKPRFQRPKNEPRFGRPKMAPRFSKPIMQTRFGKQHDNFRRSTLSEPDKFLLDQEIKLERLKSAVQTLKDNNLATTDDVELGREVRDNSQITKPKIWYRQPEYVKEVNEALHLIEPDASNTPNTPKSHQKSPALKHKHQHKNAPRSSGIYNVEKDLQHLIQHLDHHGTHANDKLSHCKFANNRPKFEIVFVEGDDPTVQIVTQPMVYLRVAKKQEAIRNLEPVIGLLRGLHWDQVGNMMDQIYHLADLDDEKHIAEIREALLEI